MEYNMMKRYDYSTNTAMVTVYYDATRVKRVHIMLRYTSIYPSGPISGFEDRPHENGTLIFLS